MFQNFRITIFLFRFISYGWGFENFIIHDFLNSAFHLLSGEFIVRLLVLIGTQVEFMPFYDIEMTGVFFQEQIW